MQDAAPLLGKLAGKYNGNPFFNQKEKMMRQKDNNILEIVYADVEEFLELKK